MTTITTSRRNVLGLAAAATLPPFYMTMPKPMPHFAFSNAAGRSLTLADFRGKFVLLNIWATWCAPCRKEIPALNRLQAKFGGPRFEVVPVSIDTGGLAAVKPFYKAAKLDHLGIFLDPTGSAMRVLNLEGVPTSFLINPLGQQIGRETGGVAWSSRSAERFIGRKIGLGGNR